MLCYESLEFLRLFRLKDALHPTHQAFGCVSHGNKGTHTEAETFVLNKKKRKKEESKRQRWGWRQHKDKVK